MTEERQVHFVEVPNRYEDAMVDMRKRLADVDLSTLAKINEPLPNIETVETKETLTENQVEQIVKLPKDAFTNVA